MNKIMEFIKAHPYGVAAAIIGVGIAFILLSQSGGATTAPAGSGNDAAIADDNAAATQAATQLQAAQLQAQTTQAQYAAQEADTTTATNGQVAVAQIQSNQSTDNTNLAAQVAALTASLNAETSQDQIGAQASVDNNQTNAQLQESLAQTTALQNIAEAPYEVQLAELGDENGAENQELQGVISNYSSAITTLQTAIVQSGVAALQPVNAGVSSSLSNYAKANNLSGANS